MYLLSAVSLFIYFFCNFRIFTYFLYLGMISDWSLLLYGTEIPAQPSDPQHSQTPVAGRFKPSNQANPSITSQVSTTRVSRS